MRNDGEMFSREAEFHDRWSEGAGDVKVVETFESIASFEHRFALELMGDIIGKKILDIGPGLGESSTYFAMKGAEVTAVDISSGMVDKCVETARLHGVEVKGVVCSAEELDVDENYYDVVFAANVIHHLADRERMLKNSRAALVNGGMFIAIDPLKYNPVINAYRRIATSVRTEDERPLGYADFSLARKYFPDLRHREFWFLTLSLFLKYFLVDRKSPNEYRYWKIILDETQESIGGWFGPLARIDSALLRLPFAGALAWNTVQWGTKQKD